MDDISGGTAITALPSVLLEREASEIRRGRPAVALDLVQVRAKNVVFSPSIQASLCLLYRT